MHAAVIALQGKRDYMEDCYFLDPEFKVPFLNLEESVIFGGIYDGHSSNKEKSGSAVSAYCRDTIPNLFLNAYQNWPEQHTSFEKYATVAFIQAYMHASETICRTYKSGSCATNFLIWDQKMIIHAHVGDSRILIVRTDEVHALTRDHRPTNIDEALRICAAGGEIDSEDRYVLAKKIPGDIFRQGLGVTRSLGDREFTDVGVIPIPATGSYIIRPNDLWLIAASDGLWDFVSDGNVWKIARPHTGDAESLVEELSAFALKRKRGSDNITIVAVRLNEELPPTA